MCVCVCVCACACACTRACVSMCDVVISCGCSSFVVRYNWFHHCLYAQHSTYLGNNALYMSVWLAPLPTCVLSVFLR